MRVEAAGAWMLVVATRGGASQGLSQRERQVALHYVQGLSYKEIARELGSSPSTVRTQLQTVYRRLGVHSRTQLHVGPGAVSAPASLPVQGRPHRRGAGAVARGRIGAGVD